MANVITTLLRMDSTQFKTGMRQAQQSIKETDGVVSKAKAGWGSMLAGFASSPVAIGAATAAVGVFASQSISAASDLEESINAVNVTFGEASSQILEFGDNAAKSVGLAKSEFNQLATPLGSILKNAGFDLDTVAEKTIILTQRAADMASVFNTDVSEALGAIQAGLRGEQDPLERFGVGLSAAKVEARALADSGKETAKQLTDQEKQLARVNIILEQTNQTAGDFANTSDSLANQTKVLKAEFKDLQATAGKELIPILSDLAAVLIDVRDASGEAKGAIEGIPGGEGLLDALGTNLFELPKKSKEQWDNLGRSIGVLPDKAAPAREELDRFADSVNADAEAVDRLRDSVGDADEELADLGDKAANSGPKIGDMAGALDAAEQHLADLAAEAQDAADNALSELASAVQGVAEAVDTAFSDIRDRLDLQGLLDDITDQFGDVADAQKEAADGGEKELRDYNREVRDLREKVLRLAQAVKDIPPDKRVQIATQIETASVDQLYRILGQLAQGVNVPVTFAPQSGFDSVNGVFSGSRATPIINGARSPQSGGYVDNSQTTYILPVGTSPTSVTVDRRTYDARNQFDRQGIR